MLPFIYGVIFLVLFGPSVKVFGFESEVWYNFRWPYLVSLSSLIFFVNSGADALFSKALSYRIIRKVLLLMIILISCSAIRYFMNVQIGLIAYKNYLLLLLSFVSNILLFESYFSLVGFEKFISNVIYIFLAFLFFNAIIGLGTFLGISVFQELHFNYFNNVVDEFGVKYFSYDPKDIATSRVFVMFEGATQYGAFGYYSLIIISAFDSIKRIALPTFMLAVFACFVIVVVSESVTAVVLFFLVLVFVVLTKFGIRSLIVLIPISCVLLINFSALLGDRVLDAFSSFEFFMNLGQAQRLVFWNHFFDTYVSDYRFYLYGIPELGKGEHGDVFYLESDVLNMLIKGGLMSLIVYFSVFRLVCMSVKLQFKSVFFVLIQFYFCLNLFAAFIQGSFISLRFITINALILVVLSRQLRVM